MKKKIFVTLFCLIFTMGIIPVSANSSMNASVIDIAFDLSDIEFKAGSTEEVVIVYIEGIGRSQPIAALEITLAQTALSNFTIAKRNIIGIPINLTVSYVVRFQGISSSPRIYNEFVPASGATVNRTFHYVGWQSVTVLTGGRTTQGHELVPESRTLHRAWG